MKQNGNIYFSEMWMVKVRKNIFAKSKNRNLSILLACNCINSVCWHSLQHHAPANLAHLLGDSLHRNHTAEAPHQSVCNIKAFLLFLCITDWVNQVVQGTLQLCYITQVITACRDPSVIQILS